MLSLFGDSFVCFGEDLCVSPFVSFVSFVYVWTETEKFWERWNCFFSTEALMFFRNRRRFLGRKCLIPFEIWTHRLRIHTEYSIIWVTGPRHPFFKFIFQILSLLWQHHFGLMDGYSQETIGVLVPQISPSGRSDGDTTPFKVTSFCMEETRKQFTGSIF